MMTDLPVKHWAPHQLGWLRRPEFEDKPRDDNPFEDDVPHVYEKPDGSLVHMAARFDRHTGMRLPDEVLTLSVDDMRLTPPSETDEPAQQQASAEPETGS